MLFETGRVCFKLAGRDAGKRCIVIDHVDAHTVLIDGETRRRKCNVKHLEPTEQVVSISKGASTSEVKRVGDELGFEINEKKVAKKQEKKNAPRKIRKQKAKPVKEVKVKSAKVNEVPKKHIQN